MAVQQNKPTRSKRGMRRSHDALTAVTSLSVDKASGEKHLRHHITADGFSLSNHALLHGFRVARRRKREKHQEHSSLCDWCERAQSTHLPRERRRVKA